MQILPEILIARKHLYRDALVYYLGFTRVVSSNNEGPAQYEALRGKEVNTAKERLIRKLPNTDWNDIP